MFGILAKFFRFSGRENSNKFKLSMVIGLIEALASAMKIPAIMYILIGLQSGKSIGKYIGGSIAIMVIAIVVDVICKRYSTVLQTEGGYNASEPVKPNVIKERPLSSGVSDRKATQSEQPAHRQNVEKVVSQETRQNYTKDRRTKVQQTQSVQKNQQTTEKSRNLVTKKGQKKK